jgi:hypothetical protein
LFSHPFISLSKWSNCFSSFISSIFFLAFTFYCYCFRFYPFLAPATWNLRPTQTVRWTHSLQMSATTEVNGKGKTRLPIGSQSQDSGVQVASDWRSPGIKYMELVIKKSISISDSAQTIRGLSRLDQLPRATWSASTGNQWQTTYLYSHYHPIGESDRHGQLHNTWGMLQRPKQVPIYGY